MRENIKIVLIGILVFTGGLALGSFVMIGIKTQELQDVQNDADYWENRYNNLLGDYNDLLDDYNILFGDYQSILSVLEDPLTNPVLPTNSELYYWLEDDNTDTHKYTENWRSGDFSAMLMVRAKEMNWRMRISCMFWSYDGDVGWQDPAEPYGSYGHAFNVILCQDCDGDGNEDWLYVEPQTDRVWYVIIGAESFVHYDIWLTFTGGITGTVC
ncbi:MAG: hypothetical protein CEE42_04245 [Promethearchaeota archaeon Loki_b31]|nr:MAG: hypothetical protein CEE42_04245 [Candidatus Lokiarchaeota archaeon Loki_b31]